MITGALTCVTLSTNEHADVRPALSFTVQLTVVLPSAKLMEGVHTIPGVLMPDSSHADTGSVTLFVVPLL